MLNAINSFLKIQKNLTTDKQDWINWYASRYTY